MTTTTTIMMIIIIIVIIILIMKCVKIAGDSSPWPINFIF